MVTHKEISLYRSKRGAHGYPINLIVKITQKGKMGLGSGKEK